MRWTENWGPGLWVYFDDLFHAANMACLFLSLLHVRVVLFKEKRSYLDRVLQMTYFWRTATESVTDSC